MNFLAIISLAQVADASVIPNICESWKMSNDERNAIQWLVARRDNDYELEDYLGLLIRGADRDLVLALIEVQEKTECWEAVKTFDVPVFPINGNDLIACGVKPGPDLGKILVDMKEFWIQGGCVATRNEIFVHFRLKA